MKQSLLLINNKQNLIRTKKYIDNKYNNKLSIIVMRVKNYDFDLLSGRGRVGDVTERKNDTSDSDQNAIFKIACLRLLPS